MGRDLVLAGSMAGSGLRKRSSTTITGTIGESVAGTISLQDRNGWKGVARIGTSAAAETIMEVSKKLRITMAVGIWILLRITTMDQIWILPPLMTMDRMLKMLRLMMEAGDLMMGVQVAGMMGALPEMARA
jgi:hypothetical protein